MQFPSLSVKARAVSLGVAVVVLLGAGYLIHRGWLPGGSMDFALRQKVSAQSVLHFSFPEVMDQTSVQKAITASTKVDGEWSWDGNVLLLHPAAPLKAGATYNFLVPSSAMKDDGTPLGRDLEFVFTVAGPPVVAARIPGTGATMIKADSRITLVFDRPMIPLSQVQGEFAKDTVNKEWPVTITPPIDGRWRWLSTVAREFIPSAPLKQGTLYSIAVPAGIPSVAGDKTEKEFSWSFETERPVLTGTTPEEGSRTSGPTSTVQLSFNREMDPQSAMQHLSLFDTTGQPSPVLQSGASFKPTGKKVSIKSVAYAQFKDEDGKTVTDKTSLVVTPAQALSFNGSYALFAEPGIRGSVGDLGTLSGTLLHFRTVGDLSVSAGQYQADQQMVTMSFSNPLNADSLAKGITITPAPLNAKDFGWSTYSMGDTAMVQGNPSLLPSTAYTVTVNAVKDEFGQTLPKPFTFSFTTPQVRPEVSIDSKGEFGIFEKTKPPIFYLSSVNVSALNVQFAKLNINEFLAARMQKHQTYDAITPLQGKEKYAEWSIKPTAKHDKWGVTPLDVQAKSGGELASGIYAMQVRAPEYMIPSNPPVPGVEQQIFAITNLAVTMKYSGDNALVWVTDMRTGDPVKGARITFHTLDGKTPRTGVTDAQGLFQTAVPIEELSVNTYDWIPEFWVTAETDTDIAFVGSDWSGGIEPYNFDLSPDFRGRSSGKYRVDAYVYTERPIYKAGDTMHFKGLVRLRDWQGAYSMPTDRQAAVHIQDAEGNEVFSKTLPISQFGSFQGDFPIDAKASLGAYYLNVQLTPDTEIGYNYISTTFSVLAYRKPEYKVAIDTESDDYFNGDTVKATIDGSYYFGAPMGGANVVWRAQTTDYFFNKYTDGWYSFSLEDSWCWYDCQRTSSVVTEGKGTLDAAGKLTVQVPANIDDKSVSQVLTIEADVTDANNQVVSNRSSVYVHKADAYVGVRTLDYAVQPGQEAAFDVVTVQPDGKAMGGKSVSLQLYSRTWNSIRKKNVDGEYYYDNEPQDTFIRSTSVTTNEQGKATAKIAIPSGGEFRVVAMVTDGKGRQAKSAASVYAWSSTYVNWPRTNSDRIDVIADKPEYKPGDTAVLLVKSPYQGKGVKALVTVERENVLQKQVIDITSNAQPIKIPITQDLLPNVYVSVAILKPRVGETFDENGIDTGVPAFKIGYAKLSIDVSSKELHLAVKTDKDRYAPGEKVHVTITSTDAGGKPVAAEVSLGTVDMSLLALSSFETPDLTRLFYAERGLGVNTAELLTYLLDRYKPGSKGGGGGSAESKARGNFLDTAYWNPTIVTDAQGTATLSFTLPDNLTTWQLLAVGSTKSHLFGSQAMTILETKKVILRPVRPRFAVTGDQIQLGAIVHNFEPTAKTFTVSVTGSGMVALPKPQTITVQSGQQTKVLFPITAAATRSMTLDMKAAAQDAVDEVIETIPVYPFATPQSVATTGITETVALEKVIAPTTKDAKDGSLTVSVSPTLAAYLPQALDYLVTYPYGCAEQTLSSFLPSVVLSRLDAQGATKLVDAKQLDTTVTAGLQRIYTFQRGDGGFGYFEGSNQSYAPLSAYVLYGLVLTRQSGYAVDEGVISRTVAYLSDVLRNSTDQVPLTLTDRATILFALSEAGQTNVSLLDNLATKRADLPLFAQAQLAMAYEKSGSGKGGQVLKEILNRALVDSRGTHFEEENGSYWGVYMNTTQRTTAMVLQAMVRIDPDNALIPNVTRYLLTARKDGHWDTTQSTVYSLLAFSDYLKQTGELSASYDAGVDLNGTRLLNWHVGKGSALQHQDATVLLDALKRGAENEVKIGLKGTGRIYYDLLLSYLFTGDRIEPAEEGIGVTRTIRALGGKQNLTDETLKVGETYSVTLTVTVPEERHAVAVESPVPAGMEIVDVSLQTSQQQLLTPLDDSSHSWDREYWERGLWAFNHTEVRDDGYFLFADTLPAGVYQYTYLARATTPGTYRRRPTRAFEMYFPEVFGQTDGALVTVKE